MPDVGDDDLVLGLEMVIHGHARARHAAGYSASAAQAAALAPGDLA